MIPKAPAAATADPTNCSWLSGARMSVIETPRETAIESARHIYARVPLVHLRDLEIGEYGQVRTKISVWPATKADTRYNVHTDAYRVFASVESMNMLLL